jgi:5-deoxy-glucuronate isomerase
MNKKKRKKTPAKGPAAAAEAFAKAAQENARSAETGILRREDAAEGMSNVLSAENAPLKDLSVSRLRIDARNGAYKGRTGAAETLLHLLIGNCTVECAGSFGKNTFAKIGSRRDVFSGLPTSVVVGPNTNYRIIPHSRTVDFAVAAVPYEGVDRVPVLIRPEDVRVHQIGEGHAERSVREVIGGEGFAQRLRAGETVNPVGKWSSWPHHDFDADPELAGRFEEVFIYFTKPRYGWGIQKRTGLYCDLREVDDVQVFRNGDAMVMPLGDHPVVAGVDSEILYVWFYISPIPKVYSRWAEDVGGYA